MSSLPSRLLRRSLATLTSLATTMLIAQVCTACTNEHARFCEETTTDLCEQCWSCASSDAEASELCGLDAETDKAGCQVILRKVCVAEDLGYNVESARACQERVERLGCEQLRADGKPDVCGRLF